MTDLANPRQAEADIDSIFLERWSPRSYLDQPVSAEDLKTVFEAARWAPSCYNEQPWLFLYTQEPALHAKVAATFAPTNHVWAQHAPVAGIIFGRRRFTHNGKDNAFHAFDAGAAAFAMSLQANRLGLGTHLLGGFDPEPSYELFGVPREDYVALTAFVMGHRGDPATLPEEYQARELPSARKELFTIAMEGRFQA
jgi:nitroreductase